jgi:hydroxyethylthiazole kinase-like sugar kinase family protein
MKPFVPFAALLATAVLAASAGAEPLAVGADATIEKIQAAQVGKSVTVRTGCSEELTGKVKSVSSEVLHLAELSGKEFFDAVIATDDITSVVIRTR